MSAFVVDTNVLVVANDLEANVSRQCIANCVSKLEEVRAGILVIDDGKDGSRILREYRQKVTGNAQYPGSAFLLWLFNVQYDPNVCERVTLTQREAVQPGATPDPEDYAEFPDDPALKNFDRSDRKFAAAACASKNNPEILHATDTRSWVQYREKLEQHGIYVRNLCPDG